MYRFVLAVLLPILFSLGCKNPESSKTSEPNSKASADSAQRHNSDHSHSDNHGSYHRHGIHGGHIFEFKPQGTYLGEWVQNRKNDLIRIYILDSKGEKDVPVDAENLILRRGETLFSLDAETPNEDGKSAIYSLEEKDLAIAINLGIAVEMTVGDTRYEGEIPPNAGH